MSKRRGGKIPKAEEVGWVGLCPCGCGAYYAALIDQNEKTIATFGWDRDGWVAFLAGVMRQIDGESNDGHVCEHHTAH